MKQYTWLVVEGGMDYGCISLVAICTNEKAARKIRDKIRKDILSWNWCHAARMDGFAKNKLLAGTSCKKLLP